MTNNFDILMKIANETAEGMLAPEDQELQQAETDEVQQQNGSPQPEGLAPEEAAVQQQMQVNGEQEMVQQQQAREQQHAELDRALLEGAAQEAITEMADDEIRDVLISKAASEMLGLGALSSLIDLATGEHDQLQKEAANQILTEMTQSSQAFLEGLDKVASDLYSTPEQQAFLFSGSGVDYVMGQLHKLNDFDSLTKIASEDDAVALSTIAENEGEMILNAQAIVDEAVDEAVKEIVKEQIKEDLIEGEVEEEIEEDLVEGEGEEEIEEDVEEDEGIEQTAAFNALKSLGKNVKGLREAKTVQKGEATKMNSTRSINQNKIVNDRKKDVKNSAKKVGLQASGVAAGIGAAGAGAYALGKNKDQEKTAAFNALKSLGRDVKGLRTAKTVQKGEANKMNATRSINQNKIVNDRKKDVKNSAKKVGLQAGGVAAGIGATGAGAYALGKKKDQEKTAAFNALKSLGGKARGLGDKTKDKAHELGGTAKNLGKNVKAISNPQIRKGAPKANPAAKAAGTTGGELTNKQKVYAGLKNDIKSDAKKLAKPAAIGAGSAAAIGGGAYALGKRNQGEEKTAAVNAYNSLYKQANFATGAKRLLDNAKKVKENRLTRDQLSTEMANLERKVQLNGITKNPEDAKRAAELMEQMQNITRDVRTGEAIRYGVPGAAMFGGAAWGGKKLADSKKNNE